MVSGPGQPADPTACQSPELPPAGGFLPALHQVQLSPHLGDQGYIQSGSEARFTQPWDVEAIPTEQGHWGQYPVVAEEPH